MVLHKIKNPGNALVLRFPGTAEGCSVDVDVKSASAGFMTTVVHVNCGFHYLSPRHFVLVIFKAHGVSHYLHSVREAAVGFNVDVLRKPVADVQKRIRIVTALAALVDLKFHAEIALRVAVKYRVRLVAVFVNGTVLAFLVAAVAVGVIIVIVIVGTIPMNDSTAAFTGRVVIVVAGIAERHTVRACIIVDPDSVTAMLTSDSFSVVAVIA